MARIQLFVLCLCAVLWVSCSGRRNKKPHFTKHKGGYYYQLLAFQNDQHTYAPGRMAWLSATFSTLRDSVFWDSDNNLQDAYYVALDTLHSDGIIKHFVSRSACLDSACLLIPTDVFFRQQFRSERIPDFCVNDSVVKVHLKIKNILTVKDYLNVSQNLREKEESAIESYFGSLAAMELAADPRGFYWVVKPATANTGLIKTGDLVGLSYEAYYLNGRFFEKSPSNFEFVYGTPDQLLKGLNYAIGYLKMGDNAKIIVPSSLAFGKEGSSNGIVPPYTPLLYQIRINYIKSENTL